MARDPNASDDTRAAIEDVQARLSLVEEGLSDSRKAQQQSDSQAAQQARVLDLVTEENVKLKATRSELEFDLNACRDDLAAARQECLLLKHDNDNLQRSEDRLVGIQAELAEAKEQLDATRKSVLLLEHDIEDLRQRESELLATRSKYGELRVEQVRVVERHEHHVKRLEERLQDREARLKERDARLRDREGELSRIKTELGESARSLKRVSEANSQARAQIKRHKAMYDLARSENGELDALVEQLAGGVEQMMASRRWRLGHLLLSLPRRMVFRRIPPMVTERLIELVSTYRQGRIAATRQWQQIAEAPRDATGDVKQ